MSDRKLSRFINYLIFFAVLFAVYLWSAVFQNIEASPTGYEAQISFLDVGQADAALINLPGSTQVLVDGGENSSALDKIRSRMPAMDKKIEYVVATHPDQDHIGGLPSVVKSYEIGEFISNGVENGSKVYQNLNALITEKKIPRKVVKTGDEISLGIGVKADILWPNENLPATTSHNEGSIVIRFDYKGAKALLMADAETGSQNKIMAQAAEGELKSQVYKVPHHGAGTALNNKFIEAVSPQYAVISVGKNNQYGHPTQAVLDALNAIKAQIFRTDQQRTIDFVSNGGSWTKR